MSRTQPMADYDYIVVGGGSSGCALTHRLTARSSNRVLLIEAGNDYLPGEEPKNIRDTFFTAAYVKENLWPDTRVQWLEPKPGMPAPVASFYEQARVIGGGSSVNAMVGLRGTPADFEEWCALGATGWSWEDVQPFYQRLETDLDFTDNNHGRDGPITVRRHARSQWPPFVDAVAREIESRGFGFVDDVNAGEREGVGRIPMTSLPTQRMSAAMGYLTDDVRRRPNLQIMHSTQVQSLEFDSNKVVGVNVNRGGRSDSHRAREVILCAGSYRTPALMMRSGIGPAEDLRSLGIEVHTDLPGVGANLHDHPTFAAAAHLRLGATQHASLRPHANAGLFYSSGHENCPSMDMYLPFSNKVGWHPVGKRIGGIFVVLLKPFSRGRVTLRSADHNEFPRVEVNAFGDERDVTRLMQGMRFAHELLNAPRVKALTTYRFGGSFSERVSALNTYNRINWLKSAVGEILLDGPASLREFLMENMVCPGSELDYLVADDRRLETWMRKNVTGFFHPVGTCRMGAAGDAQAVVDPAGRVHGAGGLRVADASVMPSIVRATTNLTAIMIGEKMAQSILDET